MTTKEVLEQLKRSGSASIKATLLKHGAREPFYGVKVEDMKKLMKKIPANRQQIALDLFASGIGDAQYMAGLMANGHEMDRKQLQEWAEKASWQMISEYSVPWVASEHPDAFQIGMKWIDAKKPEIATAGWNTLSSVMATRPDRGLDMAVIKKLLARVKKEIHTAPNRVKYCMNGFVIAVGSYVTALNKEAMETGKTLGGVEVDMNGTYCKVPFAPDHIRKVMDKGNLGKKKKTVKC